MAYPIIKKTSHVTNDGIKVTITGESGSGKTFQTASLSRPFVISSENGLLSLRNFDIQYVEISSIEELAEVKQLLITQEVWESFDTLVIDSVTDIAERCLLTLKKSVKDARQAYGQMMDKVMDELLSLCSIKGKDLVCIYKLGRIQDPLTGKVSYSADVPSDKFASKMPYLFDEVFVLKSEIDAEGNVNRYFQTFNDGHYTAKDRSGCLEPYEPADLGAIIRKIKGGISNGETE